VKVRKFGDWAKVAQITRTMRDRFEAAVRVALLREAQYLRGKMVTGIASGAPGGKPFAPLSPITLAIRKARGFGGSKPLIVTGTLRRSPSVVQVGGRGIGGAVFVGIHRSARGKNGKSLVNIAEIHEFGRSWKQKLSPKARRFLFAMLRKAGLSQGGASKGRFSSPGGSGTISINIPARPFVRPTFEMYAKPADVKRRFMANIADRMGGTFKQIGGTKP
jgi:hypothetical protein